MRDAVLAAFMTVMKGEEVQIAMKLRLPIGERYFSISRCVRSRSALAP